VNPLGIFARTFPRPTPEENLDAVRHHRLGVVQYNLACAGLAGLPERIEPRQARRIGAAAASRRITIAAVSGTFNLIDPIRERRDAGMRCLHQLAGACALLGTKTITLCMGTRDPDDTWSGHPPTGRADAWADLLRAMEQALVIAEEYDLWLAVEPETATVLDSPARARRLLDELRSPRLKIIIDPANLVQVKDLRHQRAILDAAFCLLGPDIVLAHARDVRVGGGKVHHVAPGTGLLDYRHYLDLLRHVRVPLIVHGLAEAEVKRALAFLRGALPPYHDGFPRGCADGPLRARSQCAATNAPIRRGAQAPVRSL
jgi:sugar phosphate isomerase/epimerase